MSHVERSSHFDVDEHNKNLRHIEQVTQAGKDEQMDPSLRWLGFQPKFLSSMVLHQDLAEGTQWKQKYEKHCQLVFSRGQHYWHSLDAEGNRVPLKYCAVRRRTKAKKNEKLCKIRNPRPLNPTVKAICEGNCKEV